VTTLRTPWASATPAA